MVLLAEAVPLAFITLLSWYVLRNWLRWSRNGSRFPAPKARTIISFVGFLCATASLATIIIYFLCSALGADVIPEHAIWVFTMLSGLATALFGIIAALAGTGQLEIPTVVCSVLCLLAWIAHA
jgi:hypothetical protein